jgi:NAD(P) transhydrogenase subunit alpha
MIVGVPKETFPGEKRVAIVPAVIPFLTKANLEVSIEAGAGVPAGFPDASYEEKGVRIVQDRGALFQSANVILQVRGLGANPEAGRPDLDLFRPDQVLIALMEPLTLVEAVKELAAKKISIFAMELIPRIARAQSMDSLSSMATVAGYKAVLLAADSLPKMFPMMMTAAGTIAPARVFVIGAGVAGLQAIATARRLGAVVHSYDIRPAVKEQVESLGAKFVELDLETKEAEAAGGYAKVMDEEFYRKQREVMNQVVVDSDVVITTAAVPGKKAPVLITGEMVKGMKPGSVIVDLAAEQGGNCELTQKGETIEKEGIMIIGTLNLPSSIPYHASQMYAKNISNLLLHLVKEGKIELKMDDEIIHQTLLARGGEVVHPDVRKALGLSSETKEERGND